MEIKEVVVPLIAEDFEAGDRVYRYAHPTDYILFGTVKAVKGRDIIIDMDNGLEFAIPVTLFRKRQPRDFWWGKTLPLAQVNKGTIISCYYFPGSKGHRLSYVVNEITTDSITFTCLEDEQAKTTMVATEKYSLEYTFKDWIIEE